LAIKPELTSEEERKIALIPGAEPSARLDPWWWLVVVAVALTALLIFASREYNDIFHFVLSGITITAVVTVVSYVLMLIAGMLGALGRLSKNFIFHGLSSLYVEIVRGIPLLVQLIMWYFVFPSLVQKIGNAAGIGFLSDWHANPVAMAIVGLTFCYGAYMSEIFRAGIQSIPKGQMEASRSLGMSYVQAMRHIILPQAVRVVLPPVGNEFVSLLKDSSLVSVVAVTDLTLRGRQYMSTHFDPIQTWTMVALLYLIMTLFSSRVVSWLEKRSRFER
jgi:polar amino acid transport system permease protein